MSMTRPTTEQITHKGQLLSDVLDRPFNLLDYGAVGDGVTDDMDALIAAVNAVKAAGGGTLYIPFTPNGYYLRRGIGCQLGGTNGISIVSNNATLKLQGGTLAQTLSVSVFYSSIPAGVQNLLIQGLRFEAASTVLRYGNGGSGGAMHFDAQVNIGQADPLEQSSFRAVINLQGASNNITIRDCYFGEYLFDPVKVTDGAYGTDVENVKLINLEFYGTNSQSIFVNNINKLTIQGIYDLDHKGSKFDWMFYLDTGITDLVVSDVVYRQTNPLDRFGASAIGFDGQTNGAVWSNILIDGCGSNAFVIASSNATLTGITIKNVPNTAVGAMSFPTCANIVITGLVIIDCPWCISLGGTASNVSISDFVFRNATRQVLGDFGAGSGTRMSFSHGTIIDCGSNTSPCIRKPSGSTAPVNLRFDDVRFMYTTYVPLLEIVDVRGPSVVVELSNCVFESLFGTSAKQPIYTSNSAVVSVLNCSKTGWSTAMTYSGAAGANVIAKVTELPLTEPTLTVNSATPSVLGNMLFVTANITATAITNFTDGVQGQEICVRVNDANTTFDFSSSNLKGNNGVDYTATSGDLVFAKRIGSNWYCTVCEA